MRNSLLDIVPSPFLQRTEMFWTRSLVFDILHKNCISPSSLAGCTVCEKDLYMHVCCIHIFISKSNCIYNDKVYSFASFVGWNRVLQASFSTGTGCSKHDYAYPELWILISLLESFIYFILFYFILFLFYLFILYFILALDWTTSTRLSTSTTFQF